MDAVAAAALGWLGGGVVNWLADSLPIYRRPVRPRCPVCGAPRRTAAWLGLIDALSGSRCRYCAARRGARPWVIELVSAVLAVWLVPRGPVKVLLGGAAGFLILWLMYLLGLAFSRWMSRRRGTPLEEVAFGFGDVMLGGLIGLVVGRPDGARDLDGVKPLPQLFGFMTCRG